MNGEEPPTVQMYDMDIEQALLGAMLIDERAIARAASVCECDDFFDPLHQRLADFMFRAGESGRPVNPLMVKSALRTDPGLLEIAQINKTGDPGQYLVSLAKATPAVPNVEDYGRVIADLRAKRDAADAMAYSRDLMADPDIDAGTALAPIIEVYDRTQARGPSALDTQSIGEASGELLKEAEAAEKRKESIAIPTGSAKLDDVMGGLYPGNLIIAGGRPGMGKSILGMAFCKAAEVSGFAPHLFSLEMSRREVSARAMAEMDYEPALAAGHKPLAYNVLLHHKGLSGSEWDRAIAAQEALNRSLFDICDRGKLNINQIGALARARASRLKGTSRGIMVVIDHLQIVGVNERRKDRTRNDEIAEITGGSKELAKRLACPVVLLSQLRREVDQRDDKHPQIADFREGGSIEQDADVMLGLYRPFYYAPAAIRHAKTVEARTNAQTVAEEQKNLLEVEFLKNRNGPTPSVNLWIDVRSSVIRDEKPGSSPAERSLFDDLKGG